MSSVSTEMAPPRVRARYVLSMMAKGSMTGVSRAKEIRARFAKLISEMAPYLNEAQVAKTPHLFDLADRTTAAFIADFARARDLLDGLNVTTSLDELDSAVLTATLSWRIALHSAQLKRHRWAGTGEAPVTLSHRETDRDALSALVRALRLAR